MNMNWRRRKMSKSISEIVYETSINEIEKLNRLTIGEIEKHPLLLKASQIKKQPRFSNHQTRRY